MTMISTFHVTLQQESNKVCFPHFQCIHTECIHYRPALIIIFTPHDQDYNPEGGENQEDIKRRGVHRHGSEADVILDNQECYTTHSENL